MSGWINNLKAICPPSSSKLKIKIKIKILECCLLQILLGTLKVKTEIWFDQTRQLKL